MTPTSMASSPSARSVPAAPRWCRCGGGPSRSARSSSGSGRSSPVARVVAFIPDLLFGSNVVGALSAAGDEVQLVSDVGAMPPEGFDVLVVDLTADAALRIAQVADLTGGEDLRTLA